MVKCLYYLSSIVIKSFNFRLNMGREFTSFITKGRAFHRVGPLTDKALSANLVLVLGITKLPDCLVFLSLTLPTSSKLITDDGIML